MNHEPSQCEDFEMLISAMVDGELSAAESAELSQHLGECSGCCQTVKNFDQVDSAVSLLSRKPVVSSEEGNLARQSVGSVETVQKEVFVVSRNKSSMKDWLSPLRLIPLAAAAALLIALGITMFPSPQPATANSFSTDPFVQPMKELHLINVQQQRDQDLMLRTLTMDLRALKLDLNRFEPGSDERNSLAAEIDLMIAKVQKFESSLSE